MSLADPVNEFVVAAAGGGRGERGIVILRPPVGRISEERALELAAWIVAIVGDRTRFFLLLDAVEST